MIKNFDKIFPTYLVHCLSWYGINNILGLIETTEKELLRIPNFGKKSLAKVKDFLEQNNLSLRKE